MNIKKVIKNQKLRYNLIRLLEFVPDALMLRIEYRLFLKRYLNLKNPKRFTEKLQVYKLKYRNPVLGKCVDKYKVREYVAEKGLSDIMPTLYGVYRNGSEIDFDSLPNQFVIKTNNGGDGDNVILCFDKNKADLEAYRSKMDEGIKLKRINPGKEWAYDRIETPCIIAEELLVDRNHPERGINDYKFFCFDGEPYVISLDSNRFIDHKRNFYDMKWNMLAVNTDKQMSKSKEPEPAHFERMKDIARKLSKGFPFVRVDLYNVNGKIYFSELTFYPWSGFMPCDPDSFDFELGNKFNMNF